MRLMVLCLWACWATAGAQVLDTAIYPTSGRPSNALWTPDGKYVLVDVNGPGGAGGIDVFRVGDGKLTHVAFQALPPGGGALQGLAVAQPGIVVVGESNAGVALMPLAATLEGKAVAQILPQGNGAGTAFAAASPDGQTVYVSNEYGNGGNVGVIALNRDAKGEIHPQTVAHIPTPRTTPGLAVSPDGKRVYTSGEVLMPVEPTLAGQAASELGRTSCSTGGKAARVVPNGVVYVIDADKAKTLTADPVGAALKDVVRSRVAGGCSPVREVVSGDGKRLFVTLRADDRVLVFDTAKLESDPDKALVTSFASGGDAPVGLALFDKDRKLLVANSDRFNQGAGKAVVIDVTDGAGMGKILQTVTTGAFPRNIHASEDGRSLLLTVFSDNQLMVLRMK